MSRFFYNRKKAGFNCPQVNKWSKKLHYLFIENCAIFLKSSSYAPFKKGIVTLVVLFAWIWSAQAQVEFKVELLPDNVTYQVSFLPSVTWGYPQNITSTAQVTMKVPTGGMGVSNVTSLIPGTFWANNGRFNSPAEAPEFDYISFGLTSLGTSEIPYEEGVETPIFTFVNDGICTGGVELMLEDDVFYPPNSQNANVSNQLATYGAGAGNNAFVGPYGVGSANCLPTTSTDCPVEYQITQQGDGTYAISMQSAVTWNAPDNTTETLITTVVTPTGTFSPTDIIANQSGANFIIANSFIAPTESPNFDYFVFELENAGTSSLSYQEDQIVSLFSFKNMGNCEGDSLFLLNPETDPFALQNTTVGHFLETTGSGELVDACFQNKKLPIGIQINNVNTFPLSNCEDNNASIAIETMTATNLEYSIDGGQTWQSDNFFPFLSAGEYWVMVRYTNGTCEIEYNQNPVIIEEGASTTIDEVVVTQPSGCGVANGAIEIIASSDDDLEYSITNGQTWQSNNIFNGLGTGTYFPTIRKTDLTCEDSADAVSLDSNESSSPVVEEVIVENVTPCDAMNGTISFASTNDFDVEYSIDNGENWSSNPDFNNLAIGEYQLIARNPATNCTTVYDQNPVVVANNAGCNTCLLEYELELLPDGVYQVSIHSDTTWNFPQNITSTAQVTIVVNTGTFEVGELTNLIEGVDFTDNSRVNAPAENPAEDYISFGLETLGTTDIPYQTGLKVPLFTFRNIGSCSGGDIHLMRDTDPFAFPNSQFINVGQQLTTVGAGQDAEVCIKGTGIANCLPRVEAADDVFNFNIYSNPTYTDNVIENDTNYLSNGLNAYLINGSTTNHGTVDLQLDGTITYTPNPGFSGMDTMLYTVCDDVYQGACDMGMVTFVVSAGNILMANDDAVTTLINTAVESEVASNDVNLANNGLSFTLAMPPDDGTLSFNEDGTFSYLPNLNFIGTDAFIYQVCDDGMPQVCDFAEVEVSVVAPDYLYAVDDYYFETFNTTISENVSINDYDPNDGVLTYTLLNGSDVASGSLVLNTDGSFDYTPDNDFIGIDGFDYVVCNDQTPTECDTARVTFDIMEGLMANDDSYTLDVNSILTADVTENDLMASGTTLTATVLTSASNGNLVLNTNGTFSYQPVNGFVGLDMFTYKLCDDSTPQNCENATVQLIVSSGLTAVDDNFNVGVNSLVEGDVISNDWIPADVTTFVSVGNYPQNGNLFLNPDGTFTYQPDNNFLGEDSFTYTLCDNGMPQTCDVATVYLNIASQFMAVDDEFIVTAYTPFEASVLPNDIIPNGVSTTTTHIVNPHHGVLIIQGDGNFDYIPDNGFVGVDSFMYRLCDNNFPFPCDTATVILNVFPQLSAVDDSYVGNINSTLKENVLANDWYDSNASITVTITANPVNGNVEIDANGDFNYYPNNDYVGNDQFAYEICEDATGTCSSATVSITIENFVNAENDQFYVTPNTQGSGNIANNDFVATTDFTVTELPNSGPNNGNLTLDANGNFLYTPFTGFEGEDQFQYIICDTQSPSYCDTATVNIIVGIPPMLTAVDDYTQTTVNVAVSGNVLTNDENPANGVLTANIVAGSVPDFGTIELEEDGSFTYQPNAGFIGNDSVEYEVCDDGNPQQCDVATLFITVNENSNNNLQTPEIICPADVCGNDMMHFSVSQYYSGNVVSYAWINAMGDQIGSLPILEIAPNNPEAVQPFRVRVIVDGEETDYSTACFVEQAQVPVLAVTNSGPMACMGSEVQLLATPMPNLQYEWRRQGETAILSTLPNTTMEVEGDATYELTVKRADCSVATAIYTTSIEAVEAPDANPAANYNMGTNCTPEALALSANSAGSNLSYVWTSSNGFYSTQENPSLANVDSEDNGAYTLTVTNDLGCSITKTIAVDNIIDFIPEPIITYTGPTCMGQEVELNTQYYSGFDVDYVWTKNGQIMPSNSSNQLVVQPFSPVDTGMYRVVVKVDNCIHESDEFAIQILETPEIAPDFSMNQPCEGGELILNSNTTAGGQNANYQWTGPNGFTSNAENPVISNTGIEHNGSYVLTMTAENGCQKSETFDIAAINAVPAQPSAFANGPICEEGEVILTIQNTPSADSVLYEWKNGNGVIVGNTEVLTMGATDPMMVSPFSVKVIADGCESDLSDPIEVIVENPVTPELEISSDFLCEGESLLLNASLYSGQNINYQWYFDDGIVIVPLSITTNATVIIDDVNESHAGRYFVVAQVNGCSTDTSNIQQVNVFSQATPPLATNSSELTPACHGEDIQLEVPLITGATYEWFGPAGFTSNVINPVLENSSTQQAGEYFAVINFNGCNITSTSTMVQIQDEIATPFLQTNNGQHEACLGGDLTLEITNPTDGATYEFYNLQTGERVDSTTNSSITINDLTAAQAGQYYATTVVGGCPSPLSNYFEINVMAAPNNIAEAGDNQTLCSDFETLNLNAITPDIGSGQWIAINSGTVLNPMQPNSQVTNLEEGTNLFIWTLSTAACQDYSVDSVYVFTEAIDAMDDEFAVFINDTTSAINVTENDLVGNPDEYTFHIVTLPSQGELIDLGNGMISYVPFPGAFGEDQFRYMICSNTCDEICDMATARITLVGNSDEDYFVPNTITPNGDGFNDAFVVPGTIQYPGSEVSIFNRLGDEVYFSDDYKNDWAGTYKNKPLPVGTYFYSVRLTDEAKTVLKGYVVIKR